MGDEPPSSPMPRLALSGLLALTLLILAPSALAQTPPSDARIQADAKEHVKPNATRVTVRGTGNRAWNDGVWEYNRSVTIRSPFSEMPGVEIENYGDVVYQSHGSTYQYKNYRTGDWRYFGIPDPSADEIQALLETDPEKAYPHGTLDQERSMTVLAGEETYWHNPESVTVKVQVRSKKAVSYTEVAETESVMEVRMYRETRDGPWTSFNASRKSETEIGRETFSAEAVRAMRTLRDAAAIAGLEAEAAALPDVAVPTFSSGMDLAEYLYRVFREGDRPTVEATLRAVLAPRHFVDGSTTAVGLQARQEILDPAMSGLFGGSGTFAGQTCASMVIDEERTRRGGGRIYILSVLDVPPRRNDGMAWTMEVKPEEASGGYSNGRALPGRIVLGALNVGVSQKQDDLAYLASFSSEAAKCPGAAGQAVQNATQGARDSVNGVVEEGRRRLGRLFGRGNN